MEYQQRELNKAINQVEAINNRKLGIDSNEQITSLLSDLNEHINRAEWFLNGSYGTEYAILYKHWLNMLPNTPKRRENGLKNIAANAFIYSVCL